MDSLENDHRVPKCPSRAELRGRSTQPTISAAPLFPSEEWQPRGEWHSRKFPTVGAAHLAAFVQRAPASDSTGSLPLGPWRALAFLPCRGTCCTPGDSGFARS